MAGILINQNMTKKLGSALHAYNCKWLLEEKFIELSQIVNGFIKSVNISLIKNFHHMHVYGGYMHLLAYHKITYSCSSLRVPDSVIIIANLFS